MMKMTMMMTVVAMHTKQSTGSVCVQVRPEAGSHLKTMMTTCTLNMRNGATKARKIPVGTASRRAVPIDAFQLGPATRRPQRKNF